MLSLNSYRLYTSFFLVFITSFYSHSLYYSGFFFEVPQDFILFCLILFYVFFKDFLKIYLTESEREKCEPMQAKDQAEGERSRFPAVQGPPHLTHPPKSCHGRWGIFKCKCWTTVLFFFLIEPNLYRPYNSRMSFLGIHSSEMHSCVHHKTNIIHNIQMEITQNSIKIRMFK